MAAAYVRRNAAATESPRDEDESSHERLTRNWNELLQELRVTQTGVQILTGFLLTVPFTDRFTELEDHQVRIYLTVLIGATVTTCMIVAPVAFHRVLFRQREKDWLVVAANTCARIGLILLGIVSSGVVLLVFDVVVSTTAGIIASALVLATFAAVWFATPFFARR
ncbi:sodium:proton antiporter [Nocardioides silvaticus]|uniref:Sodium:proton antiporter n=1 Tax=Nocardioides silvaticus TaxID=2201891 RepID=A0A316TDX8_9ACTN|nr:DUF6328 family protein [Nocardioides silvaticus]PWN01259.1 sodium:proton antiporter [Nocardioides silvaticus]